MERELDLFAPHEVEDAFREEAFKKWQERYQNYVFPVPQKIIDHFIHSLDLRYEYELKLKQKKL